MKINTDFESWFISVNNFRLVCLLPIAAYTYICTFVFDPRVGRYEKSKMFLFLFINIIYELFNTTKIQNILLKTLSYPIQKIFEFWKRDTWNHSQFLFNNFNKDIINHSNHRIFIFTLLTMCKYNIFYLCLTWKIKRTK
jgi:hypothetical protein